MLHYISVQFKFKLFKLDHLVVVHPKNIFANFNMDLACLPWDKENQSIFIQTLNHILAVNIEHLCYYLYSPGPLTSL